MRDLDEKIKHIDNRLADLDEKLRTELIKIRSEFPNDILFGEWLRSADYDAFVDDLGLRSINTEIESVFDDLIMRYDRYYDLKVTAAYESTILRDMNYDTILRSFSAKSHLVRDNFYNSILSGQSDNETLRQLQGIGLSDAQSGTVLQTTFYNFSRMNTISVFADEPDARFRYEGGVIPTSSDQCKWLVANQKEEGYTMEEIRKGIETPYFNKKGQRLIVNELGRVPNFNCIHTWEIIEDDE